MSGGAQEKSASHWSHISMFGHWLQRYMTRREVVFTVARLISGAVPRLLPNCAGGCPCLCPHHMWRVLDFRHVYSTRSLINLHLGTFFWNARLAPVRHGHSSTVAAVPRGGVPPPTFEWRLELGRLMVLQQLRGAPAGSHEASAHNTPHEETSAECDCSHELVRVLPPGSRRHTRGQRARAHPAAEDSTRLLL
jgi:hypothetical protein